VILVDINLLIYAHMVDYPQHDAAREWLDTRLNGSAQVGLPWHTLLGFVRVISNRRTLQRPISVGYAWQLVEAWLDRPRVWIPQPTERHREILSSLLPHTGGQANLVPDAHLAALALEHGLIVCSTDGDFARFPHLRWENPLRPST
jgi:toxin-antitoxin system PIN domain toxin